MAPEKQVSPEEKLLKVIQGGDADPSSSAKETPPKARQEAAARTVAAPASKADKAVPTPAAKPEKAPPVAKQDAKSKLKVAASDQSATSPATPKPASPVAAKPATAAGLAAGAAPARKRPKRKVNLRTVNSSLAAIVLVILCLLGYQIWAAIETSSQDQLSGHINVPRPAGSGTQDVRTAQLVLSTNELDGFEKRPLIGGGLSPIQSNVGTPIASGWILYAKDNLKLAAFIGEPGAAQKAVIMDKKLDNRMIFVKLGDKIAAGDQDVKVDEFQSDKVILSDGVQKQAVK
jgi:hypothetical protein